MARWCCLYHCQLTTALLCKPFCAPLPFKPLTWHAGAAYHYQLTTALLRTLALQASIMARYLGFSL